MNKQIDTLLTVENIRLKAHHGWYEEERAIGGMYSISVQLRSSSEAEEHFDGLASTVNYELIYNRVTEVMKAEHRLIEHCCKAIFDALKPLDEAGEWTVELIKENPPIKQLGATKFKITG